MHTVITESGSVVGRTHKRLTCGCDCSWLAGEMCVRLHVVGKRALLAELHVTVGTRVGLVAGVYFFMIGQRRQLAKGFVASLALVRFRIDVCPLVIMQRAQLRESSLAHTALVRFHQLVGLGRAVGARVKSL